MKRARDKKKKRHLSSFVEKMSPPTVYINLCKLYANFQMVMGILA